MNLWEKVRKDLTKGLKEGVAIFKGGTVTVREKAEELTEEGKRQYKIFTLKRKVRDWMAELGGKVYELSSRAKSPRADAAVKSIIERIKKLEAQIEKLEGKTKTRARKKAPGK